MAYCDDHDIVLRQPEIDLVKLTDDRGLGEVNQEVLAGAKEDADSIIDSHISGRLDVPLSPVPKLIRRLSVDLTLHFLHQRRGLDTYKGRYDDARGILEEIRAGRLVIGVEDDDDESAFFYTNKTKEDREFNDEVLGRMP